MPSKYSNLCDFNEWGSGTLSGSVHVWMLAADLVAAVGGKGRGVALRIIRNEKEWI